MVTLAYCDDNELQRELLNEALENFASTRLLEMKIDGYADGQSLLAASKKNGYQIYVLDMVMPGMNGLEVASTLRARGDAGKIIFLTSSLEYCLASYDVDAFYYMLKPLQTEKFYSVLDKAIRLTLDGKPVELTVSTQNGDVSVAMNTVAYCSLNNRNLEYHLKDGRIITSRNIRTSFRDAVYPLLVSGYFSMCGVSTVVNLAEIDALDSDSILLRSGELIYPPRSAYSELKNAWRAYRRG